MSVDAARKSSGNCFRGYTVNLRFDYGGAYLAIMDIRNIRNETVGINAPRTVGDCAGLR